MRPLVFRLRDYHPLWPAFPVRFRYTSVLSLNSSPSEPERKILQPPDRNG